MISEAPNALERLCQLYGIDREYADIWGQQHRVSRRTQQALLAAMGVPLGGEDGEGALEEAILAHRCRDWRRRLAPVHVTRATTGAIVIPITVRAACADATLTWRLVFENGERRSGSLQPSALPVLEQQEIYGVVYTRYRFVLPAEPRLGYHRFSLRADASETPDRLSLIITPDRCYQPAALAGQGRIWGLAVQLYALRSRRNWGVGDFTDLRRLIEATALLGVGIVGLNPLHALFPHNPNHASPYSPSSRLFLNPLYLDIEALPDFAESPEVQAQVRAPAFQAQLKALRQSDYIDYAAVAALKLPLLEQLYRHFRDRHLAQATARAQAFRAFQAEQGETLNHQALYEALQRWFHRQDAGVWGWPAWPAQYRSPKTPAVAAFAKERPGDVEFFAYLQWQADQQLQAAAARARDLQAVGLYRDLAVGVDRAGAETWAQQELYALDASIGCPPDDFNLKGQNWGLPPMVPDILRENGYHPFITTLRANMRHAGALRIDHVMGLLRLFWVPSGEDASHGTYVRYPLSDLLGILALESERHRCLIVGEDLGTVPEEIRTALSAAGVFSYRLFYFQRDQRGEFLAPEQYPEQALAAVTTHDLATLAGFWHAQDWVERSQLDMYPSAEVREQELKRRMEDRARLLRALDQKELLPPGITTNPASSPAMMPALMRAVHVHLAHAPAKIMLIQPEDVLGQITPVNLPGTTDQRPNWRQRLTMELEDFADYEGMRQLAMALQAARRSG